MDSAYVGLLEETGSLFVMSPERYPLVVFGTGAGGKGITKRVSGEDDDEKMLDAPGGGGDGDDEEQHPSPDTANSIDSNLNACLNSHTHSARCLIGIRRIEEEGGYASEGRLKRLLDGPKAQGMIVEQGQGLDAGEYGHGEGLIVIGGVRPEDNQSSSGSGERHQHRSLNDQSNGFWMWLASPGLLGHWDEDGWKRRGGEGEGGRKGGTLFEALVLALGVGAASGWVVWKRIRRSGPMLVKSESREGERKEVAQTSSGDGDSKAEQAATASSTSNGQVDKLENGFFPSPPLSLSNVAKALDRVELDLKPLPDPPLGLVDDGCATDNDSPVLVPNGRPTPGLIIGVGIEDGDTEGEGDVDVPARPGHGVGNGRKRARRGKRGKKKRPAVSSGISDGNGVVGQEGGEERESRDDGDERPLVVLTNEFKRGEPLKAEQQQRSALVLSDTILGKPFPKRKKEASHYLPLTRLWLTRHCRLPRHTARPLGRH
jgi:serine/threonine-protein kinase/endoribonuclease IRE1